MWMKNLRKKLLIIVVALILVSCILNIILYRSFNVSPKKLKVNTIELKNKRIPQTMNGVSILYFTDLQFGEFQTKKRCEALFKTIHNLHPDVLIFGGDLFDIDHTITEEDKTMMIEFFSSIEAPLGKYAILGENDTIEQDSIQWIYSQSQCELLVDTPIKITNQSDEGIQFVGMSLQPNYDIPLASFKNSTYNLLVVHQPDALLDSYLKLAPIDLALAGHSHGTQLMFPIYGGYKTMEGAMNLNRSKHQETGFEYIISSGVGCTNINARLNAPSEIYYFILQSTK